MLLTTTLEQCPHCNDGYRLVINREDGASLVCAHYDSLDAVRQLIATLQDIVKTQETKLHLPRAFEDAFDE